MMKMELEEVRHCHSCGGTEFSLFLEGRDYLYYSPLAFKLIECNRCGLLLVSPRPVDMSLYYPIRGETMVKDILNFPSPVRVRLVTKIKARGRILDVGCGQGYFLKDMERLGWEAFGNELSGSGCEFAKNNLGLKDIYNADLLDIDFPGHYFDVVTMWHTLEHMKYPLATLKKINSLLTDDGILIVETPNFSSFQFRFFKEKCYALDLPRHLFGFTPAVLKRILSGAGFVIFGRDGIVNPHINFVSLRMSLLRWLGIYRLPKEESDIALVSSRIFNIRRLVRKGGGVIFSLFCGLCLFIMTICKSDVSMRVYCRKAEADG